MSDRVGVRVTSRRQARIAREVFDATHDSRAASEAMLRAVEAAAERAVEYARVGAPVLEALGRAGASVLRVSEVDPTDATAIKVIQDHMDVLVENFELAEEAIYLLGHARAQPAGRRWLLYEMFPYVDAVLPAPNLVAPVLRDLRYSIGDAMRTSRDPQLFSGLVEIVEREELGVVRRGFVAALGGQREHAAHLVEVLRRLLRDDGLWSTAARAAARLGLGELRPDIEQRISETTGWSRSDGMYAIRAFDRQRGVGTVG
ncbi:hypothetical protein [Protaetiibacter larvae]|uniref:Uncharacterized protein n=1 Tax=Protaetiibacter larvae TaxID=2592654 RepID=A0A5C1Y4F2_9MICO|nr:hypothetical protein [Protaetiibacter larvae]QEO08600.1 hypothetical protein FLP23_00275 [Protaetiibacter larvae]